MKQDLQYIPDFECIPYLKVKNEIKNDISYLKLELFIESILCSIKIFMKNRIIVYDLLDDMKKVY